MKLYTTKCPHCGGNLDVEDGMEAFFCKFCGTKIIVDKTELEIRRMEHEERIQEAELKSEKIVVISVVVGSIVVGAIILGIFYFLFSLARS